MIYNNEYIDIEKVLAYLDDYIIIISKDGKKEICLNFNSENYNFKDMKIKQKINIVKYLYWDTTLKTSQTYYLFDISKEEIYLTKLEENKFRIEINIDNPDIIYCPLGENESFLNFKVDTEFSFIEECKLK